MVKRHVSAAGKASAGAALTADAPAPTPVTAATPQQQFQQARQQSQALLAELLHVQHAAVLKMEKRTDMYLAILRNHVAALGGTLQVVARFPGGEIKVSNFSDPGQPDGGAPNPPAA